MQASIDRTKAGFRLRGKADGIDLVLPLMPGINRLGSSPNSDLMLEHEGISRQHAIILVDGSEPEVIDQKSKNGTSVDGRRIERAYVADGSVVSFGSLRLVLEAVAPEDSVLAWEMTPRPLESQSFSADAETTSPLGGPTGSAAWMRLIRDCAEMLRHHGGSSGEVLARVCVELGADGGHLVSLSSAGLEVLASNCEPDPILLRRALPSSHQLYSCGGEWFDPAPHGRTTTYGVVPEPESLEAVALILLGDFPERESSLALLQALMQILLLREAPHLTTASPELEVDLRFPPGYVRGCSPAADRLHEQLGHLARADFPVLIVGETGVGKEWMARILHHSSTRRGGPLVAINCAALPAELLEAELFGIGHKVATGVAARSGRFVEADGGTLFLDEIGEMPQALQAKLLRVLQEGKVEPLGAPTRDINVRVLAATNADVHNMVEQGIFRRDLFFRLAGYVLEVPNLRQRREDIPLFVERLIRSNARSLGKSVRGITVGALRALMDEAWPGNVRELEHQIRRLVHLCPNQAPIDSTLLESGRQGLAQNSAAGPSEVPKSPASNPAPGRFWRQRENLDLATVERELIKEALHRCDDNQVHAAELLGLSRYSLRRRIERHGI